MILSYRLFESKYENVEIDEQDWDKIWRQNMTPNDRDTKIISRYFAQYKSKIEYEYGTLISFKVSRMKSFS